MKINKLFIAAVAFCMLFASCSKDLTEPGNNSQAGGETYAKLVLKLPADLTKAEDVTAGTTVERNVNTIAIYVYDPVLGTFTAEAGGARPISDFTPSGTVGAQLYTSNFAVKTTKGMKRFLLVINPTATVSAGINTLGLNTLNPVAFNVPLVGSAAEQLNWITTTGMVMSGNANMDLPQQTEAEALAPGAPVLQVEIYRNVAKVFLEQPTGGVTVTGAQFSTNIQYTLIAKALNSHFQEQTNTLQSVVPTAAIDPTGGLNHTYYTSNFTTTKPTTGFKSLNAQNSSLNGVGTANGDYVFENVPSSVTGSTETPFRYGNTTAYLLSATLVPDDLITGYDITTGNVTATRVAAAGTPAEEFYVYKLDNTAWRTSAYNTAIGAGAFHLDAADFKGPYLNGVGYYNFPVQDASAKFGVKRNYYYIVTVNEIIGFGSPTLPETPPPYDDTTWIKVSAQVHAWNVQTSIVDVR